MWKSDDQQLETLVSESSSFDELLTKLYEHMQNDIETAEIYAARDKQRIDAWLALKPEEQEKRLTLLRATLDWLAEQEAADQLSKIGKKLIQEATLVPY